MISLLIDPFLLLSALLTVPGETPASFAIAATVTFFNIITSSLIISQ
jgi:hypothetical protein